MLSGTGMGGPGVVRQNSTRVDDSAGLRRRVVAELRRVTPFAQTDFALDRKNDRDARTWAA